MATVALLASPRRRLTFGRLFPRHTRPATRSGCFDVEESCADWALSGECVANPGFMLQQCSQSCTTCDEDPANPRNRTVAELRQRVHDGSCYDEDDDCMHRAAAGECHDGSGVPLRCPYSCHACGFRKLVNESYGCYDLNAACASWASSGECSANRHYMAANCAASCDSCREKTSACARPDTPAAAVAGTIEASMRRILSDFPEYAPTALMRPGVANPGVLEGSVAPWIIHLRDFLSDEEVDMFIGTCHEHFERSLAGDQLSPVRTSKQCWCADNECGRSALAKRVEERVRNLTNIPSPLYFEPFQVLKYEPGQFYKVHHDQNSGWFTPQGVRLYTFFMYLSTVSEGGGTRFTDLNLTVPAVKGSAVLWPSVTSADPSEDEPNTNHEGLPPVAGVKYAANAWIHNYDYRTPASRNCPLAHRNTHNGAVRWQAGLS